jgi:hypothetical protein
MNTTTVSIAPSPIEVVVYTPPEVSRTPPPKRNAGPLRSPLPIQYDFTEPVKKSAMSQWLMAVLRLK